MGRPFEVRWFGNTRGVGGVRTTPADFSVFFFFFSFLGFGLGEAVDVRAKTRSCVYPVDEHGAWFSARDDVGEYHRTGVLIGEPPKGGILESGYSRSRKALMMFCLCDEVGVLPRL